MNRPSTVFTKRKFNGCPHVYLACVFFYHINRALDMPIKLERWAIGIACTYLLNNLPPGLTTDISDPCNAQMDYDAEMESKIPANDWKVVGRQSIHQPTKTDKHDKQKSETVKWDFLNLWTKLHHKTEIPNRPDNTQQSLTDTNTTSSLITKYLAMQLFQEFENAIPQLNTDTNFTKQSSSEWTTGLTNL